MGRRPRTHRVDLSNAVGSMAGLVHYYSTKDVRERSFLAKHISELVALPGDGFITNRRSRRSHFAA